MSAVGVGWGRLGALPGLPLNAATAAHCLLKCAPLCLPRLPLQGGRDEMLLFLNSRCQGPPCARLRCNMFATQASPAPACLPAFLPA